jgi:hypothetical protein
VILLTAGAEDLGERNSLGWRRRAQRRKEEDAQGCFIPLDQAGEKGSAPIFRKRGMGIWEICKIRYPCASADGPRVPLTHA